MTAVAVIGYALIGESRGIAAARAEHARLKAGNDAWRASRGM